MTQPAIQLQGIYKHYGSLAALKAIDLTVQSGDFFALLGPNGAGKSTTIGIISGLIAPDTGTLKIAGMDANTAPIKVKQALGVVPQEFNFNIFETVWNTLIDQAGYYGIPADQAAPKAEYLLNMMQLWEKRHQTNYHLSGGMKRRLMIARALMHDPQILILDEPTAGVDIELRRLIWEFLRYLNQKGLTIILTTHYLEEAEQLCNRVAIIDKGEVIVCDEMQNILTQVSNQEIMLELEEPLMVLEKQLSFNITLIDPHHLSIRLIGDQRFSDLIPYLYEQKIKIKQITTRQNRLEDLFIHLTQGSS